MFHACGHLLTLVLFSGFGSTIYPYDYPSDLTKELFIGSWACFNNCTKNIWIITVGLIWDAAWCILFSF